MYRDSSRRIRRWPSRGRYGVTKCPIVGPGGRCKVQENPQGLLPTTYNYMLESSAACCLTPVMFLVLLPVSILIFRASLQTKPGHSLLRSALLLA